MEISLDQRIAVMRMATQAASMTYAPAAREILSDDDIFRCIRTFYYGLLHTLMREVESITEINGVEE